MEKCEVHFWDDVGVPLEEQQTLPNTKGTSAVCFILTSTIVVHTLDLLRAVYVNIFSCKIVRSRRCRRFHDGVGSARYRATGTSLNAFKNRCDWERQLVFERTRSRATGISLRSPNALAQIREAVRFRIPSRVTSPQIRGYRDYRNSVVSCAISGLEQPSADKVVPMKLQSSSLFLVGDERVAKFNVVFLIPTGIGAEIGGHAGDATPAARLIAETCDTLILHPNVVNASDINEMPTNSLYVEGSVITRLLMGTVGLAPVRSNRVLVILDGRGETIFVNAAINAVSAARASYWARLPGGCEALPTGKDGGAVY